MGSENCHKGIDEYAVRLIKHKARDLVPRAGFAEADREDLEQELMLEVLRRLPDYTPERGRYEAFVACIVERKSTAMLRTARAQKRGESVCTRSLNDRVEDEDGRPVELADTMDAEDGQRRTATWTGSRVEQSDLAMDVQELLNRLPARLRRLCERLKVMTVSEISHETGIPRTTIYEDIKTLRALFEEAGLAEFLEPGPFRTGPRQ